VKYAISLPNFGSFANGSLMTDLAVLAEESGWDGFFPWDHIVIEDGLSVADPWVLLGAIAANTDRIAIGPMVTPLPRRRPWVLARQATTIDHLSGGRLILGLGIGFPPQEEFGTFGEPIGDKQRADMLEEGLIILQGMWRGGRFSFDGEHYSVAPTQFEPRPVRESGIPIWVAGMWPNQRPLRRAAQHQGVYPVKMDMTPWTPDEVAELAAIIERERGHLDNFDIAIGWSVDAGRRLAADYSAAGATWFIAGPAPELSLQEVRAMIASGPR